MSRAHVCTSSFASTAASLRLSCLPYAYHCHCPTPWSATDPRAMPQPPRPSRRRTRRRGRLRYCRHSAHSARRMSWPCTFGRSKGGVRNGQPSPAPPPPNQPPIACSPAAKWNPVHPLTLSQPPPPPLPALLISSCRQLQPPTSFGSISVRLRLGSGF